MTTIFSMREFLRHARYGTVLSSEFKVIFDADTKVHKQHNAYHGGIQK